MLTIVRSGLRRVGFRIKFIQPIIALGLLPLLVFLGQPHAMAADVDVIESPQLVALKWDVTPGDWIGVACERGAPVGPIDEDSLLLFHFFHTYEPIFPQFSEKSGDYYRELRVAMNKGSAGGIQTSVGANGIRVAEQIKENPSRSDRDGFAYTHYVFDGYFEFLLLAGSWNTTLECSGTINGIAVAGTPAGVVTGARYLQSDFPIGAGASLSVFGAEQGWSIERIPA